MAALHLAEYLEASAARFPDRAAVVEPDGQRLTYTELDAKADRLAGFLAQSGVRPGDRVGVVLPKSLAAVVSLFAVMKAGAAYVPVDYAAPAERGRRILTDCGIRALIVDHRCPDVIPNAGSGGAVVVVIVGAPEDGAATGLGTSFDQALQSLRLSHPAPRHAADLAYILYTSGSTGVPKGVMLTHENAVSFIEWCSSVFRPTEEDRFSSHAPFHFDLSVFDLYLSVKHGSSVHLIPEDLGKSPRDLARFIAAHQLTVWYSTPSILTLLLRFGSLEAVDASSLRLVLFAGEVFPVKHLRDLQRRWPHPDYYNLYGPTETNVCTFARIPAVIPDEREVPYPIGFPCAHCSTLVLDAGGREVPSGDEGLLYVAGSSVFVGYWNRPAENAAAFVQRDGVRWYNTGDVVRWDAGDGFLYLGRKDRMVKRRGYRIELGEIERALYTHEVVREAAVVAVPDSEAGVKIVAFLACHGGSAPSVVDLKTFCASRLPAYMSPDRFILFDRMPRTSTDKVDYQALHAQLEPRGAH